MAHECSEAYFAKAQLFSSFCLLFRSFFTERFSGYESENDRYGNKVDGCCPEFQDFGGEDFPECFRCCYKECCRCKKRSKTDQHKIGLDEQDEQKGNERDQKKKDCSFFL